MADVATIKEVIVLCRESQVTPYLWGIPGIGKSSIVRQVAQTLGIDFVDLRCAQLEAADLRGFPDKGTDGRTHFLPPGEMPDGGEGILFLDELNRASQEVLGAAFQLVLDRAVGEYRLPPGWSIACAGNFQTAEYAVAELDPALRDRFCHVILSAGQTTFDEWANWLSATHGSEAHEVLDFCGTNLKHLEIADKEELGFPVLPSRRSWDMAVRGLKAWEQGNYAERTKREFLAGLVGRELAIAFLKHRCPLQPAHLLKSGVSQLTAKLETLSRNQRTSLMWGLVSFAKNRLDEPDVVDVLLDFAEFLAEDEKDLSMAFCTALLSNVENTKDETLAVRSAILTNPRLGAAMARVHRRQGKPSVFVDRVTSRPGLAAVFSAIYSPSTQPQGAFPSLAKN